MTVEIAKLAVECAEAQLSTARELLIGALISEAGGNPANVDTTWIGKLTDPFAAIPEPF
jgi:hypothetical protein